MPSFLEEERKSDNVLARIEAIEHELSRVKAVSSKNAADIASLPSASVPVVKAPVFKGPIASYSSAATSGIPIRIQTTGRPRLQSLVSNQSDGASKRKRHDSECTQPDDGYTLVSRVKEKSTPQEGCGR